MTDPTGDIDFFISYRGAHADWALWVNWVVRSAGFSTVLMDEFQVGTTWTSNMRDAAQRCRRLIPLYSEDYWHSGACREEFDAYWRQHIQNANARFLLPLEVQPWAVPDMHKVLLWKSLCTLKHDTALATILKILEGIAPVTPSSTAYTEPEPAFPGLGSDPPAAVIDWPEKVEELKWPLADHDEARLTFAELVTRSASFKLLAIKGSSETGKSHLTEQFFNNARRSVKSCHCARFDFKGTKQNEETLATFVQDLGVPLPPAASSLSERFRHILQNLVQRKQPSLLIFDTYEDAGDAERWMQESLLNSLHLHNWLRVVIVGQKVPPCHGKLWEDDTKVLALAQPEPAHWHSYALANGRTFPLGFVETAHEAVKGKPSILAQLCGPKT